jgi:hypothetical protein
LAGRTPHAAVENFLGPLRQCLARVTAAHLTLTPRSHEATDEVQAATLGKGAVVELPGEARIGLVIAFQFRVVETDDEDRGPWKVKTEAYEHYLRTAEGKDIIAFHWQPGGNGPDWPHLHVGTIALAKDGLLDRKAHVPTGRVAVEQVLRFAIAELGVESDDDWEQVFAVTQGRFETYRTWP